jgi:acyl-CoA reductase-like NAD-dependent aldehyde dehydrogenase
LASQLSNSEQALVETGGCYVQPTILDGVDASITIASEEILGPVLAVMSFTDTAVVVRQANVSI